MRGKQHFRRGRRTSSARASPQPQPSRCSRRFLLPQPTPQLGHCCRTPASRTSAARLLAWLHPASPRSPARARASLLTFRLRRRTPTPSLRASPRYIPAAGCAPPVPNIAAACTARRAEPAHAKHGSAPRLSLSRKVSPVHSQLASRRIRAPAQISARPGIRFPRNRPIDRNKGRSPPKTSCRAAGSSLRNRRPLSLPPCQATPQPPLSAVASVQRASVRRRRHTCRPLQPHLCSSACCSARAQRSRGSRTRRLLLHPSHEELAEAALQRATFPTSIRRNGHLIVPAPLVRLA